MDRREKRRRRRQFADDVRALRGILHEWEPIGIRTPADEYDSVVHRVLSILYAGGEDEVVSRIEQELEGDFGGGFTPEGEIRLVAGTMWEWWRGRTAQDGGGPHAGPVKQ